MPTPDEIVNRRFLVALRGYDRDEVTAFQQEVAEQVAGLQARVAELETQLERQVPAAAPAPDGADPRAALRSLGEETTRILVAAEESAEEIEARAKAQARETVESAQARGKEIVDRANGQAARTIAEAERRRDAIAAEIERLAGQQARFTDALRAAVADVTGAVDGLEQPLEEDQQPEVSEPEPAPEAELEPEAPEPSPAVEESEPEAMPGTPEPSPAVEVSEPDEEPADEEPEPTDEPEPAEEPEPAPSVADRRNAALEQLRPELARHLKRGLQDVQNEVLAAIREHGGGAELDDLLPSEPALEKLGAIGQPHLADAYARALQDAAEEVDGQAPTGLADGARVPSAVATFRAVLAHEVTSSLRATLRAGLEAGEPEPQLSERVGEVFRDLRGPVAESLAEEHLHRAYAHGLLDAWQDLGVERIRWQAGDEPRCPENRCRTNAAEGVVEIGVDFPSGDRVPPAHPGCTCTIVPV